MIVPKKATAAATRCNKSMEYNRHARRFSIAMPASSEPVTLISADLFKE
jgi:hypothetical protein